jgi:hypothetical protein
MKPLTIVSGTLSRSDAVLCAQEVATPKYEVGLNYSWLHVNSANFDFQRTGNGGSEYFGYNLNRTIGLVGDFAGYINEDVKMGNVEAKGISAARLDRRQYSRMSKLWGFVAPPGNIRSLIRGRRFACLHLFHKRKQRLVWPETLRMSYGKCLSTPA